MDVFHSLFFMLKISFNLSVCPEEKVKIEKRKIISVDIGSSAHKAGIKKGDSLISVNSSFPKDVFDYRVLVSSKKITLRVEKNDGKIKDYKIRKQEYEDPGLNFESGLMDDEKACHNKCVFCFIDQLPQNMRKSLYFKDDDLRLSFLTGNFVTLTNIDEAELNRLISYKLSPMNISVHTTNPELRVQMLKNPKAGNIMESLKRISDAGIKINTQIVLCPGLNDKEELDRTIDDLESIKENILSIAIVPVGLTKHREDKNLPVLQTFDIESATEVIDKINIRQEKNINALGRRLVFASDEFYIKAERKIPSVEEYEDFYQLENGVGLVSLFIEEMQTGIKERRNKNKFVSNNKKSILLLTGQDAANYLLSFVDELSEIYNAKFKVAAIKNKFFGENVTVAGLITGKNIAEFLKNNDEEENVLIPEIMLNETGTMFLDDMQPEELKKIYKGKIHFVPSRGEQFLTWLDTYFDTN